MKNPIITAIHSIDISVSSILIKKRFIIDSLGRKRKLKHVRHVEQKGGQYSFIISVDNPMAIRLGDIITTRGTLTACVTDIDNIDINYVKIKCISSSLDFFNHFLIQTGDEICVSSNQFSESDQRPIAY